MICIIKILNLECFKRDYVTLNLKKNIANSSDSIKLPDIKINKMSRED